MKSKYKKILYFNINNYNRIIIQSEEKVQRSQKLIILQKLKNLFEKK